MSARRIELLERRRAALLAHDDLISFAQFMKPKPGTNDVKQSLYVAKRHHRAIAAALEEVEKGKIKRLIISCPPRHGKSLISSQMFPAWFQGRNPGHNIILATYADALAWDFGRGVRALLQSPLYNQVFPNVSIKAGAASVDRVELDQGGVSFFVGRGTGVTGRGGDILLVDDPLKDRREADSPTIRDHLWNWYTQVLSSRLMTDTGAIIIISTRWHDDDLVGRIIDPTNPFYAPELAQGWRIIDLPAIAGDNDVLGRQPGEALWPERFGIDYLETVKRTDARGFQALYQGKPSPEDGSFFKTSHFRTYSRLSELPPKDKMRFYGASDHAVSTEQGRDKTVLMVVGIDENDDIWVMNDLYWGQADTMQAVNHWLNLLETYKPLLWWAEKGHISKSIGPFLRKRMIERNIYCAIDEITPIGDKQQRAQSIMGRMAMGKVHFPMFPRWWPEARDQMLKFPQGVHDDFVDALAYVGLGLAKQMPRRLAKPAPREPKFGTLGWIKNDTRKREFSEMMSRSTRGW